MTAVAHGVGPSWRWSWSQLEALKWLGLVSMLADHVNDGLFGHRLVGWSEFGRLAFPLFSFTLGWALRDADDAQVVRVLRRLVVFGLISQPLTMYVRDWFAINIFFTLAIGLSAAWVYRSSTWAMRPFVVVSMCCAGYLCEFSPVGVFVPFAAYLFAKEPTADRFGGFGFAVFALVLVNRNFWAIASLPVISAALYLPWSLPRIRHFFYWAYPLHFGILAALVFLAKP